MQYIGAITAVGGPQMHVIFNLCIEMVNLQWQGKCERAHRGLSLRKKKSEFIF